MSTEANKALAQCFVESVNAGHLEWLDEVYDSDYVHHDANLPPDVQRVANGKIVEGWVNFDAMTMMQQIGAIPTTG